MIIPDSFQAGQPSASRCTGGDQPGQWAISHPFSRMKERYSPYYRISTWSLSISTLQLPDCLSRVRWSAKSKIENLEVRRSGVESGVPYSSSNLTNLNRIPSSNTRNILEPGPVRQGGPGGQYYHCEGEWRLAATAACQLTEQCCLLVLCFSRSSGMTNKSKMCSRCPSKRRGICSSCPRLFA